MHFALSVLLVVRLHSPWPRIINYIGLVTQVIPVRTQHCRSQKICILILHKVIKFIHSCSYFFRFYFLLNALNCWIQKNACLIILAVYKPPTGCLRKLWSQQNGKCSPHRPSTIHRQFTCSVLGFCKCLLSHLKVWLHLTKLAQCVHLSGFTLEFVLCV